MAFLRRLALNQARAVAPGLNKHLRAGIVKSSSNSISLRSSGTTPGSSMSLTASLVDTQDHFVRPFLAIS